MLHELVENCNIRRDKIAKVAKFFKISRQSVTRIWGRAARAELPPNFSLNEELVCAQNSRKNCRRNKIWNIQDIQEHIKVIPHKKQRSMRDLASNLQIPLVQVHCLVHHPEKGIVPHTSALKPMLTEENKLNRLAFCLDERDENGLYKEMFDCIHIDEKWFYVTDITMRCYLAKGEHPPVRKVKHKSHVEKVMFLSAVARPRYNPTTRQTFDGLIGIWPVVEWRAARCASRNRAAGTMEPHNVIMTKEVYLDFMLSKLLPAIAEKCPDEMKARPIRIQQDNAKPHCLFVQGNAELYTKATELGLIIHPYYQPPNSPDLNVLDLCFFRSLQSLQQQEQTANKIELMNKVITCFNMYPHAKLNDVFLTLQCCMNKIIEQNGDNDYQIPHINKRGLERQGILPRSIWVTTSENLLEADSNNNDSDNDTI